MSKETFMMATNSDQILKNHFLIRKIIYPTMVNFLRKEAF